MVHVTMVVLVHLVQDNVNVRMNGLEIIVSSLRVVGNARLIMIVMATMIMVDVIYRLVIVFVQPVGLEVDVKCTVNHLVDHVWIPCVEMEVFVMRIVQDDDVHWDGLVITVKFPTWSLINLMFA